MLKKVATKKYKMYNPRSEPKKVPSKPSGQKGFMSEKKIYLKQIRAHKNYGVVRKSQSQVSLSMKSTSTDYVPLRIPHRTASQISRMTGKLIWEIETVKEEFA